MNDAPVIELRDVFLAFEDKPVLENVSFRMNTGETLFLLGVTGSGKSVLLKLVVGLLRPDSGQVLVEGQDLTSLSEDELRPLRRRMGIVFQEGALFDSLSVYENVAYRLREEGELDEDEIERSVREVLRFVEMESTIDKMPAELSGGMRRRVSIARAIVAEPSIMLYDSPTAGLDPITSYTIDVLIAKLRDAQQVSSIVVTHRMQDAFVLTNYTFSSHDQTLVPLSKAGDPDHHPATSFLVLRDGAVYFQGTKQQFVSAQDTYLRKFIA
jgi:phospholipid/cholesterol/gamma-HCH transport system ATP-binding protein